jgi:hypothetical protein
MGRDIDPRDSSQRHSREREATRRSFDHTSRERVKDKPKDGARKQAPERPLPSRERHEVHRSGRQVYVLSQAERESLREIGAFRALSTRDLAHFKYADKSGLLAQDLRHLKKAGLIQLKSVWTGREREKAVFVALTKGGKKAVKQDSERVPGQAIYAGFVKPAELRHDAAIYPMYQTEKERLTQEASRIRRVVLDYELKKKTYSPLAKAKAKSLSEYARRQAEIAKQFDLKIVKGHLTLPDLRIEYETRTGIAAHIDLELATESYHGSHAAQKAAAGFRIYAAPDTATRLTAALEEREITAEIFSL